MSLKLFAKIHRPVVTVALVPFLSETKARAGGKMFNDVQNESFINTS